MRSGQPRCALLKGLGADDLETAVARLDARARAVLAEMGRRARWTLFVRLSWAIDVPESTAAAHLKDWATRLRDRIPGVVILVGQHAAANTHRRHAHTLVFIPRQGAPRGRSVQGWLRGVGRTFHQQFWMHGTLWLARFQPFRIAGSGDPRVYGAGQYLSREPGTVELFGTPVPYHPRRSR